MPGPRGDSQPAVSPHPTLLPSDILPGEVACGCLSGMVLLLGPTTHLWKSASLALSELFLLTRAFIYQLIWRPSSKMSVERHSGREKDSLMIQDQRHRASPTVTIHAGSYTGENIRETHMHMCTHSDG